MDKRAAFPPKRRAGGSQRPGVLSWSTFRGNRRMESKKLEGNCTLKNTYSLLIIKMVITCIREKEPASTEHSPEQRTFSTLSERPAF